MKSKVNKISVLIGKKIKVERVKKDITQEKLAELSNLSRSAMGAIERGESSPTVETMYAISKGLKIDLHKLFILE